MLDREKQQRRIVIHTRIILAAIFVGMVLMLIFVFKMPWWLAIIGTCIGFFINGLIAEWEDNLPGGFNNPHPPKVRLPSPRRPWPWSR
ncbi:hypothetical protein UAJ10_00135 [Nitrospirillum sp. BR 11164]|uniref:hypothetical protein n=1 Tax=Nitrospirillum sp. BR 11164 TaxID=3104324 RepID=UPI002AFE4263|nr:hypothetical protein [Nitrospirillum sp. BR 11164]MEA1647422.1 hypothetical protein [Nitrospirillum sp. BR 11164]